MDKLLSFFHVRSTNQPHGPSFKSCSRDGRSLSASAAFQLNATQCLLLRLPAELRNQIWRDVLQVQCSEDAARLSRRDILTAGPDNNRELDLGHLLPPPIARTCRAIRAETLAVLFAENKFVLRSRIVYDKNATCVKPSVHPSTAAWLTSAPVKAYTSCIREVAFFEPWANTKGHVVGRLGYIEGKPEVHGVCESWFFRQQDIESITKYWGKSVVRGRDEKARALEIAAIFMLADVLLTSPYEGIVEKRTEAELAFDLLTDEDREVVFRRFWLQP